jgi:hypothetical protein
VTYNGLPLYFDDMTGDSNAAGAIGCQHLNVNGGIWLIMQPNRSKVRRTSKAAAGRFDLLRARRGTRDYASATMAAC